MKIDLVKKQIKRKAIRLVPPVILLFGLFMFSYDYSSSNGEKVQASDNKVKALAGDINRKKEEYAQSEKDFYEYMKIDKNKLPTADGYAIGRDRLKVIFPIIQELKEKYSFKKLSFALSEIKKSRIPNIDKFDLYQNQIEIDFSGATDEVVFSFINDLKILLPGYLNVSNLKLVREKDINQTSVDEYVGGNGNIVSGNVKLNWSAMGKQQSGTPATEEGGAGAQHMPPGIRPARNAMPGRR